MKYLKLGVLVTAAASVLLMNGCGSSSSSSVSYGLPATSNGVAYGDFNGSAVMNMKVSKDGKTLYATVNTSGSGADASAVEQGLTILNLTDGTTKHIDTGLEGHDVLLSHDESTAYVTAGGDDNLSIIDLATNTITNSLFVGGYVSGMALTADGNTLYLGTDDTYELAIVDLATETLTDTIGLNAGFGKTPILSADETKVYIGESSGGGVVTYNIADNNFTTITTSGGGQASYMDMTSDETTAYVALGNNSLGIDVVSLVDKNITTTIYDINATDTFDWVKQVKLSADEKLLFAVDTNYNDMLFIIDLENNNTVSSVTSTSATSCVKPSSLALSPNGSKVYVGCAGVIAEFDLTAK